MLLLDLWLNLAIQPACGVTPRGQTLHAVTAEMVLARFGDKRKTLDAPCGARVRVLSNDGRGFRWPPRVATLPEGWTRCRDCWIATGRKRPAEASAA